MQVITVLDYVLLPIFLGLIYFVAFRLRNRYYPSGHPWRKYFLPGLSIKLFGALFISLIYQYYYGDGDTFRYFRDAQLINASFGDSYVTWFNLVFHIPAVDEPAFYKYTSQLSWYSDPASFTVSAVAAFLGILTYTTYIPTSLLFAALSFTGLWALFRTFAKIYPRLVRPIAVSTLFIPSVFVWGSGIFKDTICMFALGWLTYTTFRVLIRRDFSFSNIFFVVLCFVLVAKVKIYILVGFMPALLLWILFSYLQRIQNGVLRVFTKITVLVAFAIVSLIVFESLGDRLGRYSFTRIAETSEITRNYISQISGDEGSAYNLGEFDSKDPTSMLAKFPAAVNVTLYRPYLWESKKIIILLSGLESFLFLALSLRVLFSLGMKKALATVAQDPNIQFCLVFSILFAFAVSISTYNFGALSRYKIPALPYFALALVLIFYKQNPSSKKIFIFF
jgi:hypothetical protein